MLANPATSVHLPTLPQVEAAEKKGNYLEMIKGPKGQQLFQSKMKQSY